MPMCRRAPEKFVWLASPAGAESRCQGIGARLKIQRSAGHIHDDLDDVGVEKRVDMCEWRADSVAM